MTHSPQANLLSALNGQQSCSLPQMPWSVQNLTRPGSFSHLELESDDSIGALWCFMSATDQPSLSPGLLSDLAQAQAAVRAEVSSNRLGTASPIRTVVVASRTPGIWNLGGDLALFTDCIRRQDRGRLTAYAHKCVDIVFNHSDGYGNGLTTVALVQGQAMGGGFEAVLSSHIIVAERSARFGLPEVMFNLFPGMGAYNFLMRRTNAATAERMILSGKVYTAEELLDLGLIDVLAEDGEGVVAVRQHVRDMDRRHVARRAMRHVCNAVNPVSRDELIRVTDIWVETALSLAEDDLRRMHRLAAAQSRLRPLGAAMAAE